MLWLNRSVANEPSNIDPIHDSASSPPSPLHSISHDSPDLHIKLLSVHFCQLPIQSNEQVSPFDVHGPQSLLSPLHEIVSQFITVVVITKKRVTNKR